MDKRFENLPYDFESDLVTIATRLHSNHAVVMIGAGFSRNASSTYPDWQNLGNRFYSTLHPGEEKPSGHYYNIMDLADEVEASKGRATLDAIVQNIIKDGSLPPSKLHEDLLSLPWRDVFTTNYDTLLEATLPKLIGRRYSVVVKANQLAYANSPRIIKLHGSFPSETPFILTTEDYRTYSETHAPFVNTVRQAFLEKTFCLIGFSGDDPNFLSWAGWIRDYLGSYGQPIYLITMTETSSSKLALLSSRLIKVVPLYKFNGVSANDYAQGYKAFFDYLYAKNNDAPSLSDSHHVELTGSHIQDIQQLSDIWRKERMSYKGTHSISHEGRTLLVLSIRGKEPLFRELAKTSEYALGTRFCFEYLWRCDKALRYVLWPVVQYMHELIEYWAKQGDDGCISRDQLSEWDLSLDEICLIGCRLLKSYREMSELSGWARASMALERLLPNASNETRNQYRYQKSLLAMSHFSIDGLRLELSSWNPDVSDPLALARCGMLYASIKEWASARRCLSEALLAIRKVSSFTEEIQLLGMESVIIAVWKWLEENSGTEKNWNLLRTLHMRQLELRGKGCDITEDIQYFERYFSAPSKPNRYEEVKDSYDLDTKTKTMSLRMTVEDGYSFFTFAEQLGLPLCVLGEEAMRRVLKETVHVFPILSLLFLCYFSNERFAREVLTRQTFADIDLKFAEGTIVLSIECLRHLLSEDDKGINRTMFQVHVQLVTKLLCCNISDNTRSLVTGWYIDLLNKPDVIPIGLDLREFSKLLVRTTSIKYLPKLVRALASIVPNRIVVESPMPMLDGNPLGYVVSILDDEYVKSKIPLIFSDYSLPSDEWTSLMIGIRSEEGWIRSWFFTTVFLYKVLGLLDKAQNREFRGAMLGSEKGMFSPFIGNFNEAITLRIFKKSTKGFKEWYIDKILSNDWFVSSFSNDGIAISHGKSLAVHNAMVAIEHVSEWFDVETVERFLSRIKTEWEKCKGLLSRQDALIASSGEPKPSFSVEGLDRARSLVNLLAKIGTLINASQRHQYSELIDSFVQANVPCLTALTSMCNADKNYDLLVSIIPSTLHSSIQSVELDSVEALVALLKSRSKKVFNMAQIVALNTMGWASPLESEIVESIMKVLSEKGPVSLVVQHTFFNMIARWSKDLNLAIDNGISPEGKIRAIISLGKSLTHLIRHTQLNDYRKSAIKHMKTTIANPLPYVEVLRAWESVQV